MFALSAPAPLASVPPSASVRLTRLCLSVGAGGRDSPSSVPPRTTDDAHAPTGYGFAALLAEQLEEERGGEEKRVIVLEKGAEVGE